MTDYEALVNIYERYMDGLTNCDGGCEDTLWRDSLPEVLLLSHLITKAEETGDLCIGPLCRIDKEEAKE